MLPCYVRNRYRCLIANRTRTWINSIGIQGSCSTSDPGSKTSTHYSRVDHAQGVRGKCKSSTAQQRTSSIVVSATKTLLCVQLELYLTKLCNLPYLENPDQRTPPSPISLPVTLVLDGSVWRLLFFSSSLTAPPTSYPSPRGGWNLHYCYLITGHRTLSF